MIPHALTVAAALALVPLYAFTDRFAGGGDPALDDKIPGRGWVAFALLGAGLAFVAGGLPLLVAAVSWAVYRCFPWRVGGTTTPHGMQIPAAFLRHALPAFVAGVCTYTGFWGLPQPTGFSWLPLFVGLMAYAVAATGLAVAYAKHVDELMAKNLPDSGDFNASLEKIRGGIFGAALAAGAVLAFLPTM